MVEDSYYPYQAQDEFCFYDPYMVVLKPKGHIYVPPTNSKALKTAIADGPVSVGVDADSEVFQFYVSGIINSP
jgi:Papain family cysteine protease